MLKPLLHRIAQRCPTHDRASYARTSQLELELGMTPSTPPTSVVDTYNNPAIIDCGHAWCRHRR